MLRRPLIAATRRSFTTAVDFVKRNGISTPEKEVLADEAKEPVLAHLRRRGLIEQVTDEVELADKISRETISLYCGADPTARSLHLGNLIPLMVLLHFNLRGHNAFGLIGGGTGIVGDPSGKTSARVAIEAEIRAANVENIEGQIVRFLTQGFDIAQQRNPTAFLRPGHVHGVNNHSWLKDLKLIDFLSQIGPHIRVSTMLARDSVKSRLESPAGLGFNEFTYQILQGYDFYHLSQAHGVSVQVGGNDQYGNILAGVDLISRMGEGKRAFGLTVPLLTTSTGEKFGKSAGNALFIDASMTAPFQLYQFLFNFPDADLKPFLYRFSFLPIPVIDAVVEKHAENPRERFGQKVLAMEICDLIHGNGTGYDNMVTSEFLFNSNKEGTSAAELVQIFGKQGMLQTLPRDSIADLSVLELLVKLDHGQTSKSQLKRLVTSGSVQIGIDAERPQDIDVGLNLENCLIEDRLLFIKVGKSRHFLVDVV